MQLRDVADLGDTVAVWAHPDDETYLCGATMAALRDAGHRVVCVTATRGELGGQADPAELASLRTAELERALAVLGVDEHIWLDLPDGSLASVPPERPVACLTSLLGEVRPRTVLTFGPDGLTGHPDHVTVGRWTRAAFESAAVPGSRLLLAASVVSHDDVFAEVNERLGVIVGDTAAPVPDDEVAVRFCPDGPLLDRKVEALLCQASQTAPLHDALGPDLFRAWVALEAFTTPTTHPGGTP